MTDLRSKFSSSRGSRQVPELGSRFAVPLKGGNLGTWGERDDRKINIQTPRSSARRAADDGQDASARPHAGPSTVAQEPVSALHAEEHQDLGALKCWENSSQRQSTTPSHRLDVDQISNMGGLHASCGRPPGEGAISCSCSHPEGCHLGRPELTSDGVVSPIEAMSGHDALPVASVLLGRCQAVQPLLRTLDPVGAAGIVRPRWLDPIEAAAPTNLETGQAPVSVDVQGVAELVGAEARAQRLGARRAPTSPERAQRRTSSQQSASGGHHDQQ